MIQVNRIYLIFNPVHFLVDSSDMNYIMIIWDCLVIEIQSKGIMRFHQ